MTETALREKWTDSSLDSLNHLIDRRLRKLEEDIREVRISAASLAEELNVRFNGPRRDRYAITSPDGLRSFQRRRPKIDAELDWGESWTNERFDDLRSLVSASATKFDLALSELRDELGHLSGDLTIRFAALGRRRQSRRNASRRPVAHDHHPLRASLASTATPLRGPWTDGRIDDFNHNADAVLAGFECEVSEIQAEVADLRTQLRDRLNARWNARLNLFLGVFVVTAFAVPLSARILETA